MYIYILSAAEGAGKGKGPGGNAGLFRALASRGSEVNPCVLQLEVGEGGGGAFEGQPGRAAEQPRANPTQTRSSQAGSTKLQIRPISPPSKVRPGLAYSCGWRARFFPNQPLPPWIPPVPGLFPRPSRNCCPLSPTATSVLRNVRFPAPAAKRCSQSLCSQGCCASATVADPSGARGSWAEPKSGLQAEHYPEGP